MLWLPWKSPRSIKNSVPAATLNKHASQAEMRFQFMSDLHLEKEDYDKFQLPRTAPNLILAGDIGNLKDKDAYLAFLQSLCAQFERVLLVPGNHEYFHMERSEANETANLFAARLGNSFTWMDRQVADIDGTIILGCTLHSHVKRSARQIVRKEIQDFSYVSGWDIDSHNTAHRRDKAWLRQQLAAIHKYRPESRVVVVTHFPPTWEMTSDVNYDGKPTRSYYGSKTLDNFKRWKGSSQVSHWIFGHTHWNATFASGPTIVQSNQRFHGRSTKFDINATF